MHFLNRLYHRSLSLLNKDCVLYKNTILPPKQLRFCGKEFKDDEIFLESACSEADRLVTFCDLRATSRILDVGCGPGRLAIGILTRVGEIKDYQGIDVHEASIEWCKRYISSRHPSFVFSHIDVNNPRYNPLGAKLAPDFTIPFPDREFDIIYLYSVFSHMVQEDVQAYLKEFQRLLAFKGRIFLTAFVEEGVPEMDINPGSYRMNWKGPLHCVRYERAFFESLLNHYNFCIDRYEYGMGTDGQTNIYISQTR